VLPLQLLDLVQNLGAIEEADVSSLGRGEPPNFFVRVGKRF
jgi:hypothetical protein